MKKINVLVTGVGAIIGYGVINSLKKSKYEYNIVGMDIYDDAIGQYWCEKFIQAVPAKDELYIDFLKKVIKDNAIDIVFLGTEQEMYKINENKDKLEDEWRKIVINKPEIIELSKDKYATYEFLINNDFVAIPSYINGNYSELSNKLGIPFLLKPRRSYASKGIEKIHNENEFSFYRERAGEEFMIQPIIGDIDHEYTTAVFGFGDGTSLKPILLKRKLSGEGATVKATLIENSKLEQEIIKLTKVLKPIGPTNYQFRLQDGEFYLLEVNPRVSSSTSIRAALGYNESELAIQYYVLNERPEEPKVSKGFATRYIADWVVIK